MAELLNVYLSSFPATGFREFVANHPISLCSGGCALFEDTVRTRRIYFNGVRVSDGQKKVEVDGRRRRRRFN